ncbi:hypothetical protein ACEYYB_14965 [Paracoccus sp. p4-l81]|uniref:hypothetical protein n=1 Tax=Paracoccus sp. p4-l81 TaxID=3342806 RepID=UPI0035B732F2
MTHSVTIYGFGSAFDNKKAAYDIDLLVVHQGTDLASCQLAIECKRRLTESIERAHITMLSEAEEAHFGFIKTARALRLGAIREDCFDVDLTALDAVLHKLGAR